MENRKLHRTLYRWLKWPLYLLITILLLVVAIRLSLLTQPVQQWVKEQIVSVANDQLTVRLGIDNLDGDLWKEATLTGIAVSENGEVMASVDTLSIKYSALSYFSSVFEVDELRITEPFLKLRQRGEQWNVSGWMKPPEPQDTTGFPIRIENFILERGSVDAEIPGLPQDSVILLNQISMASSFGIYDEDFEASISRLSFSVEETRLGEPLRVETSARASGHSFSLEKLVIATGNSLIQSTGELNTVDSTARMNVQAEPLAWRDVAAYMDQTPVRHNLKLGLDIGGNLRQFNVGLNATADGIRDLKLGADIRWDSAMTVTGAWVTAQELNLAEFLGDTTLPFISNLGVEINGELPVSDYRQANLTGTYSTGLIRQGVYELERMEGSFKLAEDSFSADLQTRRQDQRLNSDLLIDGIWTAKPVTSIRIEAVNINPGYWLRDPGYEGRISLVGSAGGEGFFPESSLWDYSVRVTDSRVLDQNISRAEFEGRFNQQYISNRTKVRIDNSEAGLTAEVRDLQGVPRFNYQLTTQEFNLGEIRQAENFTTALTGTISGEGQGSSLENLWLTSTVRLDSSTVNSEYIEQFSAQVAVEDSIVSVDEGVLNSTLADGSFGAQMHLIRWYDPSNELNFDFQVKDVSSLAPLADSEELQASGNIKGKLNPATEEKLQFRGEIDLSDINYNDAFLAERVRGRVEAQMIEDPDYVLDLNLTAPVFASVPLQDLELRTNGKMTQQEVTGDFQLVFSSSTNEGQIVHSGIYQSGEDSTTVRTNQLELTTSLRTLNLVSPFKVGIVGQTIQMDTLRLESDDGAAMEMSASYTDSLNQQGYLGGKDLNLTVIQELLLGEAYFDGILSGKLQMERSDTAITALGDLSISMLEYQGTQFDTLNLNLSIDNEELRGELEAIYKDQKLITGRLNVPFELGDPTQFSEAFFERTVQGYLRMNAVPLSRFQGLLEQSGIANTQGILEFSGTLQGTAGNPEVSGNLSLRDAALSGVMVDSVVAKVDYKHDASRLLFNASVNSMKQNAAEIEAQIPFYINLKTFEVMLPEETDSILVDVETNGFNLAALNDFVDRQQVRNIQGQLDGNVWISGPRNNLQAKGSMTLGRGAFQVVQAGIGVDRIHSVITFEPGAVRLSEFRAESGRGYIEANGLLEFAKLVPGEIDLGIRASNFRAANTADYNAVINMDTRVAGTFAKPDISGDISFLNGFVELRNFGEKAVENVQLDDTMATELETVTLYDSLSLDLDVSFIRRFFIRNQRYLEMEIELDGQVDLQKEEGQDLQIFGTLNTASGYARPLGKRFELEEGAVAFSGPPANPQLNVRTLYKPPQTEEEVQIWYIIEGTVEDPKFKYESQPQMELENIISYTLFGQPFYALDSWKQVVASSGSSNTTVADVALDVLLDRVETLATQRLGIDVVRIENTRVGNESGTAITTGWYLNPKVFFAIQNIITGSAPDTSFLLEYLLQKNLKLIISQGNDTRQGVDLRWKFDY